MAHAPPSPAEPLADDVLRMALYYDVFKHPLTVAELSRLVGADAGPAVRALIRAGRVAQDGPHVFLPGRGAQVEARVARTRHAEEAWPAARRAARVLAGMPYVRAVLITGGLSKRSSGPDGDIDFLLLVEPGRVWTTKSALQVFRRALPERVRECFCTNYLLATDRLALDARNAFTAMELATAVPMHGADLCAALLEENAWGRAYVPGWDWAIARARAALDVPTGPARGALEAALPASVDGAALRAWDRFWDRKYDFLDDATRARRFRRTPDAATNHLHDFSGWVCAEFARRCEAAGVPLPAPVSAA
jgi:hypothetical protein